MDLHQDVSPRKIIGYVKFLDGKAIATGIDGINRPLQMGDAIFSDDQLKVTGVGIVSLFSGEEFVISEETPVLAENTLSSTSKIPPNDLITTLLNSAVLTEAYSPPLSHNSFAALSSLYTALESQINKFALGNSAFSELTNTIPEFQSNSPVLMNFKITPSISSAASSENSDISMTPLVINSSTLFIMNEAVPIISLASNAVNVNEDNNAIFTINLNTPSQTDITVNYEITNISTNENNTNDFNGASLTGQVTILANSTSAQISIPTNDLLFDNGVESFSLALISVVGGATNGILSGNLSTQANITDNDPTPQISIDNVTTAEGLSAQFTISINVAADEDIVIQYTVAHGTTDSSDITTSTGTATILAGTFSTFINVATANDGTYEHGDETFNVTLNSITSGPGTILNGTGIGTIIDAQSAPLISLDATTVNIGEDNNAVFTVNLNYASHTNITVNYEITNISTNENNTNDFNGASLTGQVTILANSTSAQISIPTTDLLFDNGVESFSLALISVVGGATNGILSGNLSTQANITDNESQPTLSINDATAIEGNQATFTVTLSGSADENVVINYTVTNNTTNASDLTGILSGQVTISAGQTTAQIIVQTTDDAIFDNNETFNVNLTSVASGPATIADGIGVGTIKDVANDESVLTNITGIIDVPDYAVLFNDNPTAVLTGGATAISPDTISYSSNAFHFTDNGSSGGTFDYAAQTSDGTTTARVTVNRTALTTLTATLIAEILIGATNADVFIANNGSNVMIGNGGDDTFTLSTGNYLVDGGAGTAGDLINLSNATSGITFTIVQSSSFTSAVNLFSYGLGTVQYANIEGIIGSNAADSITGSSSTDYIDASAGADSMSGLAGNDIYYVDTTGDIVEEISNNGTDIIFSTVSYTLPDNVENLTFLGSANINGSGNSLANYLTGNSGNNILDGSTGADTMAGFGGDDIYIVDNINDSVIETNDNGTDLVISSVTYSLSSFVENLTLSGSSNIDATGNSLANVIIGNSGNNILQPQEGGDSLDGGDGTDYISFANFGSGLNLSGFATSNATLTGAGTATTGSDTFTNIEGVIGTSSNDTLAGTNFIFRGANGSDSITGNGTLDYLDFSDGLRTDALTTGITMVLAAGSGNINLTIWQLGTDNYNNIEGVIATIYNDSVTGNSSSNFLMGISGNDSLNGGGGLLINDTLMGGSGDDTLDGGTGTGDIMDLSDASSAITLTLSSANTSYNLASVGLGTDSVSNIEGLNASLFDDSITGSNAADIIYGNDGNDTLVGGAGLLVSDTLNGGDGDDILRGGTGSDNLDGGDGIDLLDFSDASGTFAETLDAGGNGVLDTLLALVLGDDVYTNMEGMIGNGSNNTLQGNSTDNILRGGGGNDSIIGGGGTDLLDLSDATGALTLTLGLSGANSNTGTMSGLGADNYTGMEGIIGGSFSDSLTDNLQANWFQGGSGNDTLNAINGGNDTMEGGSGNDNIQFGSAANLDNSDLVDGDDNFDTLTISSNTLDLSTINESVISNIERLDLDASTNDNSVTLSVTDVIDWGSDNFTELTFNGDNIDLFITGNANNANIDTIDDNVNLTGGGWENVGNVSSANIPSISFDVYASGNALVAIQNNLDVSTS